MADFDQELRVLDAWGREQVVVEAVPGNSRIRMNEGFLIIHPFGQTEGGAAISANALKCGGHGGVGRLVLAGSDFDIPVFSVSPEHGEMYWNNRSGGRFLVIKDDGFMKLGGGGSWGRVVLENQAGDTVSSLVGSILVLGGGGQPGALALSDGDSNNVLNLSGGARGVVTVSQKFDDRQAHLDGRGFLALKNAGGSTAARLSADGSLDLGIDGDAGEVRITNEAGATSVFIEGRHGNLHLGGNGEDGDVRLYPEEAPGEPPSYDRATISMNAKTAEIFAGGRGTDGDLRLYPPQANDHHDRTQATVHLDAGAAFLKAGGNGRDGDVILFPSSAPDMTDSSLATIHLDGESGRVITRNADIAEYFDVATAADVKPGSVMVLGAGGKLRESRKAYDRKVAGVLSGANDYRPGVVLGMRPDARKKNRRPVSLAGTAYVRVNAKHGAIRLGDLLTTSPTPGHAMRADDMSKAFGAVLGKAMESRKKGRGLIKVLLSLQ